MPHYWIFAKLAQPLVLFGITGQCLFMFRFVVQWFASERRGRSYMPVAFWYFSLFGGAMVLIYGFLDHDPVIILGQSLGMGIYSRNLWLIHSRRWRFRRRRGAPRAPAPHHTEAGSDTSGPAKPSTGPRTGEDVRTVEQPATF